MKRYVLLIAAMVGLTAGCQAASPSFSSFYTNHFLTNGLVIKANLNPTQFDTNSSSITITITNVSGISGGSHWTNPVGVLKPRSGQTTNVLTFVSGSADNATNTALVVGTVNAWTDANAKLLTLRDVGTDVFYVTPHGSVEIGRSIAPWWLPDEGDILAGVHDVSQGDSERSVLHIAAVDDAVTTVNFASHTVTLQSGANAQVASTTKAEVGGVESRITVALVPDQGTADFEIINTGNETFKVNSNSGTFVHNILWALDAFAMPPSLSSNLVVGVNNIDTENEGVFNLVGPNTNPAATTVNLGNGNGVGNFFIVINNAQNSAFTMQDGAPLWDQPSAFMRLNGNFVSTNRGDAIFLYHNGWFISEIGRISGNTNVASSAIMNPTDNYLPRRQSEGVFNDSPFATPGGSTNTLASGSLILGGTNSFDYLGGFFDGLAMGFFSDTDRGQSGAWNQILGGGSASGDQAYMDLGGNANSSQASATVTVGANTYASAINIQSPLNASGHYTSWNSTNLLALRPFINDGANLYAYVFDTSTGLATTGLASFRNGATNMLNIGPTGQIIFGPGDTNVLYRSANNLVYTNGATSTTMAFEVRKGDGSKVSLGMSTGSHGFLTAGTGSDLYLGANNNGSGDYVIQATSFAPTSNGADNLGAPANKWAETHTIKVMWDDVTNVFDGYGAGSPEGVVTANVGSTYRRTDGGAGTTFYVKESGTGNTGWIGK